MNQATIESLRSQIEQIVSLLTSIIEETKTLEYQQREIEREREILTQKTNALETEKAKIKTERDGFTAQRSYVTKLNEDLQKKEQILADTEKRIDELRQSQSEREREIQGKLSQATFIDKKKIEIFSLEAELQKKEKELQELSSRLEKEKIIDRDRKRLLEEAELQLSIKQERIKKFISLTE